MCYVFFGMRRSTRNGFRKGSGSNVCHLFPLPEEWRERARARRRGQVRVLAATGPQLVEALPHPDPAERRAEKAARAHAAAEALRPFLLDLGRPDEPLRDRIRRALSSVGPEFQHIGELEEGVMTLLLEELEKNRAELEELEAAPAPEAQVDPKAASLYERRIAKLTAALDEARESIERLAKLKNVDLGLASIYRSVQGLSPEADRYAQKREMMTDIFQANLRLQERLLRKIG